ncbi:adenosylcobinamide-phosphate synthase CbiB [Evansella clarkii]|uniref:adenosylcobinamide-phosphate synthase CbiB n=1 Tax=Evansella clarkii TaxID=79879 RepID=UPI000B449DE3|nr:adenosylcobinamide-phosphate synthase CbiB [Evansella clarkii]
MIFYHFHSFQWLSFFEYISLLLLLAIVLDLIIGDPRWLPHPVIYTGKLISLLESKWNKGASRKGRGILLTATVIGVVFSMSITGVFLTYWIHPALGFVTEIYLLSTTIAVNGLQKAANDVFKPLSEGNLEEARHSLSMIVGRDTANLPESEIVRGTVETVAENTVDGVTSPLFWTVIGGAPLAMAYRAVNTLDSMVGYKNEQYINFGWASARLDDIANWLPARMTAFSMLAASIFIKNSLKSHALHITWRDARKHPSPNSGWPEAMVAGLSGVQLGGTNYYGGRKSDRAKMGEPLQKLEASHIPQSVLYMHGGWSGFIFLMLVIVFAAGRL